METESVGCSPTQLQEDYTEYKISHHNAAAKEYTAKSFPPISMSTATAAKPLGKVVHYYDNIGVAIVELNAGLKEGDTVIFARGEGEFSQEITSMHIDHEIVKKAKKGQVVGVKVDSPAKEGTLMMKA